MYRSYSEPRFSVKKMGRFYVVTTDFGLKILSKRFYVLTYLPEIYKGKVGNFC